MRCHAYHLEGELYRELEGQILEQLQHGERQALQYLLDESDAQFELLSGEWRVLFKAAEDFFQHVDIPERIARLAVAPDQIEDFLDLVHEPRLSKEWTPITFGLSALRHRFASGEGDGALVFVEESDDWLWTEHPYELMAVRDEVYELLKPHIRPLVIGKDYAALSRLLADHCEGSVEFSDEKWENLRGDAKGMVPELMAFIEGVITKPADYISIREALSVVADPSRQPSLDAWLRVHADHAQYALYFRDIVRERS